MKSRNRSVCGDRHERAARCNCIGVRAPGIYRPRWIGPVAAALISALAPEALAAGDENGTRCPDTLPQPRTVAFDEVYRGMPFQPGERATYTVSYLGMLAGLGILEVVPPRENQGRWYRVFRARARTGEWFKDIYEGHASLLVLSRPWDFGAHESSLEQEKRSLFSRRKTKQRVLDFEQEQCKVIAHTRGSDKPEKNEEYALSYGAMDALTTVYFLRTQQFEIGKLMRIPLYYEDKNLWLAVNPLGVETLTVPAGTFAATKLRLRTYFGDKPTGKRGVDLWIASMHPNRPVLKANAGNVGMRLREFVAGTRQQSEKALAPYASTVRSHALGNGSVSSVVQLRYRNAEIESGFVFVFEDGVEQLGDGETFEPERKVTRVAQKWHVKDFECMHEGHRVLPVCQAFIVPQLPENATDEPRERSLP
ncbi:MAG: DUF3108 domain-containing protein [Acidiferrobacterales bacterium]